MRSSFERLRRRELGHDVVIVGVEPLGHLERRDIETRFAILQPTRHREVARPPIANLPIPRRDGSHHDRRVEHVVVEREVVTRDVIDPRVFHRHPMTKTQACRSAQEFVE